MVVEGRYESLKCIREGRLTCGEAINGVLLDTGPSNTQVSL